MIVAIILILALAAVAAAAIGPSLVPEREAPFTRFDRMIAEFGQRRRAERAMSAHPFDIRPAFYRPVTRADVLHRRPG